MIGIIATLKVREGSGTDFEAVANQLVEKVNRLEDGVIYYDLYKEDQNTYIFLERYKDEEAQKNTRQDRLFSRAGRSDGCLSHRSTQY